MLNGLMNIGQSALNAAQAWISVTGNNIANADTEGYTRRYVDQRDAGGLWMTRPGAEGLGVNAHQIMRIYDQFLDASYIAQMTSSERWDAHDTIMSTLENVFNEQNRNGLNNTLSAFFNAWSDLALRPDDVASRNNLVSYAKGLSDMLQNSVNAIKGVQNEMNLSINLAVDRVNDIANAIADLNQQITYQTIDGVSNPNSLLDERDRLVRELASYLDVETIDRGKGDFRVQLTSGQPLVDGRDVHEIQVLGPRSEDRKLPQSTYAGSVGFYGSDEFEYTVEVVRGGAAGKAGNADNPQFRVSLDGGKSWIRNDDGSEKLFDITRDLDQYDGNGNPITDPVTVKGIEVYFTLQTGPNGMVDTTSLENKFVAGDNFDIVPKDGLYWIEPTKGPQNITPMMDLNGNDMPNRVRGGKLTAYFNIRDDNCGRYLDELDAFAEALIWEVNRLHSQGTGLEKLAFVQGQTSVGTRPSQRETVLGMAQSGLADYDRLRDGTVSISFYNAQNDHYLDSAQILFRGADGKYSQSFDPAKHSLVDLADAINNLEITLHDAQTPINPLRATILPDNRITVEVTDQGQVQGLKFAFGTDTTGLLAALGLNTFFSGHDAETLGLNSQIYNNVNFVASAQVNGQYETNRGDNLIASQIAALQDKEVTISTFWKTVQNQTIPEFYANLVTTVGADKRLSRTNAEYQGALTADLNERRASVSGVNLDEEMANLIKYQHSYTAAAKIITTADQMLQTLLGLKQ